MRNLTVVIVTVVLGTSRLFVLEASAQRCAVEVEGLSSIGGDGVILKGEEKQYQILFCVACENCENRMCEPVSDDEESVQWRSPAVDGGFVIADPDSRNCIAQDECQLNDGSPGHRRLCEVMATGSAAGKAVLRAEVTDRCEVGPPPDPACTSLASFETKTKTIDVVDISVSPNTAILTQSKSFEDNPTSEEPPPGCCPRGFFDFTVRTDQPGGTAVVTLTLPPGPRVNSYWKFGRQPGQQDEAWYQFPALNPATGIGVEITLPPNQKIILHLKDGELGDHDGVANRFIKDPGAPACIDCSIIDVPTLSRSGFLLLVLLLAIASALIFRYKSQHTRHS
jgi:hypothetical protein